MNKVHNPNFIILTISNVLFCAVLTLIFALLTFNFSLEFDKLFSMLILLLTGIHCGFTASKTASSKKLLFAIISGTIFFLAYLIACCAYAGKIAITHGYLVCALNIYFGTLIGSIMSISIKTQRKGRK